MRYREVCGSERAHVYSPDVWGQLAVCLQCGGYFAGGDWIDPEEGMGRRGPYTNPPRLPEQLLPKSPMNKFIWSYLRGRCVDSFSTRRIAAATGTSHPAVADALNRRLHALDLFEDLAAPQPRVKPTFQVH